MKKSLIARLLSTPSPTHTPASACHRSHALVAAAVVLLFTSQTLWAAVPPRPPPPAGAKPAPGGPRPAGGEGAQPTGGAQSGAATEQKPLPPPKGRFKFDFNKVQIGELAKTISDMTQRNFIIPEKIKGQTVTIMSPREVTVEEAYQAFLSALEVNDITIVPVGRFLKLVASGDAAKSPIPTYLDDKTRIAATDNIVTKIIRLNHSDATAISNILNNFKSKIAQVAVYQPTNALIVSEWGSNLVRLEGIIDKLDTEGTNDQIRLIAIKYATASEIVQRLTELFEVKKGSAGRTPSGVPPVPGNPGGGTSSPEDQLSIQKMIADDRTNQLIVVANEYAYKQLQSIIAKLDVPVGEDTGQVRVIALQNASAEDLASTLSSLATGQTKKKAGAAGGPQPPPPPGGGGNAGAASLFEGEVKITADKATNALLIIASPADFRSVKRMIDQLDIPRRQVFVETAIMEVTIENSQEAGTQWYAPLPQANINVPGATPNSALPGVINGPQGAAGTGNLLTQALSPLTLFNAFGGALAGISGPTIPVTIPSLVAGGTATTINVPSFALILKALQRSSSANVLSTPYIVATDNEEASIEVGKKQPFARGIGAGAGLNSAASSLGALGGLGGLAGGATTGTTNPLGGLGGLGALGLGGFGMSQVDRIDVSLKLSITPHINDSDRIMLEIDQQLEDIVGQEDIAGVKVPVTSKRAVKSKVVLDDQQTVVLGGLIKDNVTETVSGYPFLSDIPILGWLFKTKSTTKSKSNLLVVITPYIVRTRADYQRIFERKYAEFKAYQDLIYADSKEYRAHIDYKKKRGPLSHMNSAMKRELDKAENGGKGDAGDVVIMPNEQAKEPEKAPGGNLVQPGEPVKPPVEPPAPPAERKERLEVP